MVEKQGLAARRVAARIVEDVLRRGKPLAEEFGAGLVARDRAFAMALASATLRHKGQLEAAIGAFVAKPLPKSSGPAASILLTGAAQLLVLETPPHAAIDMAVSLAREDKNARHFSGLVNAVLRKVAAGGREVFDQAIDANTPDWMMRRWRAAYGADTARDFAAAHLAEPALDISVKDDPELWRERLGGELLPSGTIRLGEAGRIEDLPGYPDGAWWVQDAAAALPVRLLGNVRGKRVLDLCAAPGGKTAQLAAAGAQVVAIDDSDARMERLKTNLTRLRLQAEIRIANILDLSPDETFDAVLLDAPCSATGTIRRHPDLPWIKTEQQIGDLARLQTRLLRHALKLVKPGGRLVYCVCSLEAEEGLRQFDAPHDGFVREPVKPADVDGQREFISADGDLRTLPSMTIGTKPGLDGFFATRLLRSY